MKQHLNDFAFVCAGAAGSHLGLGSITMGIFYIIVGAGLLVAKNLLKEESP